MAQSKAPGSAAHQPTKAKAPAAKGTTSQQDRAIEAAIRAKLAKSKIKKDGFTVRVQGGIAYWDGTASVIQHKGSATRMAKAAGARAVVNNIKISDAARQKATQNLDQGRRGSKSSAANRGRNASSRSGCVHVCATLDVEFEWDENKRDRNLAVYGIDFVDAVSVWDGSEVVVHSTQDPSRRRTVPCDRDLQRERHNCGVYPAWGEAPADIGQKGEAK